MNAAREITWELLQQINLPHPDPQHDKEVRGRVAVIGGSACAPGAMLLTGMAALRAGAGKIQLAVPQSLVTAIGVAFVEAGVIGCAETAEGDPAARAVDQVWQVAKDADAVVIGPGIMDEEAARSLARGILERVQGPVFVIDAMAMTGLWDARALLDRHTGRVILTPHAGEMATLTGLSKEQVQREAHERALDAATRLNCTMILKGAVTHVATPDGQTFYCSVENAGLATAGSGDVLAGIVVGLAARGASPLQASLWGVASHAEAGRRLCKRVAPLGFLARELLDEIPRVLQVAPSSPKRP